MGAVIVTGAAGGIGRGLVRVLADRGFDVVGTDITGDGVVHADITDSDSVDTFVADVRAQHGSIDGLVNNAAIGPLGTVVDTDPDVWEQIFAVNSRGTYLCCRAVLPHLIEQGGGAIVNVGSGAGHGKANMAAYAASKGAVFALTASMAYDHFHDHVRVNCVVPGGGGIPSGISLERFGGSAEAYLQLPHPGSVAGRPVVGEDIGKACAYLLGDDAEAVTGTVIDVGAIANQGGPLK